MADQLCTPEDLASLLEKDLDAYKAIMLVECATAVVQEAAGNQRIVLVEDEEGQQIGTTDYWLMLPQRPVTAIEDVEIDGEALTLDTDYKRFGSKLWRSCGWAECWSEPSLITYTYSHGYDVSDPDPTNWPQDVQLARSATLSMIRALYDNPTGANREAIDDYSIAYEAMTAAMEASPHLRASLRRKYGLPAGMVRVV